MKQFVSQRIRLALIVAFCSLFVTLLFWWLARDRIYLDATDYHRTYRPIAESVLAGEGIRDASGKANYASPPGYAFLLVGIFTTARVLGAPEALCLDLFNLLCMATASVLLYLLAEAVWDPRHALLAALVWVTYPFALSLTLYPSTELPFCVFFYASCLLLARGVLRGSRAWQPYLLCGCLAGCAMLIRPIALGIGGVLALVLVLGLRNLRMHARLVLAASLLLGNLLVILPWEGWVYHQTGMVVPLGTANTAAFADGLTFAVEKKHYRQGVWVPEDVVALMADAQAHQAEFRAGSDVGRWLAQQLQVRPLAVVKLFLIKAGRSWYGTDSQRWEVPILCVQAIYLAFLVAASGVAWKRGGQAAGLALGIWLLVFYFWGMNIVSTTLLRYSIPVMGLLFVVLPALWKARPSCPGAKPA